MSEIKFTREQLAFMNDPNDCHAALVDSADAEGQG